MADDPILIDPVVPPGPPADPGNGAIPAEEWQRSKDGRFEYVSRTSGKPGIIRRQGKETIDEARARDTATTEKRPRRQKVRPPKMGEAPKALDSKELEASLTMALKAPGALAMTLAKDDWLPEHFNVTAPALSRQVILASEHNPWLRRRIEEAATGQDAMWAVISLIGMGTALFAYAVPPVVYLFNLPVPPSARARWGMPDKPMPPYAASAPQPPPAEEPIAA